MFLFQLRLSVKIDTKKNVIWQSVSARWAIQQWYRLYHIHTGKSYIQLFKDALVSSRYSISVETQKRRYQRRKKKVLQRLSSQTGCLHESVKGFCPPGNRWVRANTWLSKSSHTESIFRSTQLENPCSVLLLSALLRLLNELICDYSLQPHWCSLCHCSDGHYRCRPRQNRRRGQTAFHPFSAVSLLMLSHFFFCCLLAQPWGFFCFFFQRHNWAEIMGNIWNRTCAAVFAYCVPSRLFSRMHFEYFLRCCFSRTNMKTFFFFCNTFLSKEGFKATFFTAPAHRGGKRTIIQESRWRNP